MRKWKRRGRLALVGGWSGGALLKGKKDVAKLRLSVSTLQHC